MTSVDPVRAIRGRHVDRRGSGAAPFIVGKQGRMHRVQRDAAAPEPFGDFLDVGLAVGIIEVLAGRENLDCLHAAARQTVEDAGMQALLHKQIG